MASELIIEVGVEQHFTFNNPVKSPDEVARAVRMAARYGLAAQG